MECDVYLLRDAAKQHSPSSSTNTSSTTSSALPPPPPPAGLGHVDLVVPDATHHPLTLLGRGPASSAGGSSHGRCGGATASLFLEEDDEWDNVPRINDSSSLCRRSLNAAPAHFPPPISPLVSRSL